MRYSHFEAFLIGAASLIVIGNVVFVYPDSRILEEVIAQLLLIPVLIGAVHWGRRGGLAAAILASVIYAVMRVPMVVAAGALDSDLVILVGARFIAYGAVGIIGGELFGRIKYIFARLEGGDTLDKTSGVFNRAHMASLLEKAIKHNERYDAPFSLVRLSVAETVFQEQRDSRVRTLLRSVANHIRDDLRSVDEVGHIDRGSFLVLLPHTPAAGGEVVAARLRHGVSSTLATEEENVSTTVLTVPDDLDAVRALISTLGEPA